MKKMQIRKNKYKMMRSCDILFLNDDVLKHICLYIDSNEYIFLKETCHRFNVFFKEQNIPIVFPDRIYLFSDSKYLEWGENHSYKINKKLMYRNAIHFGNVDVLDYLQNRFDYKRKFLKTKLFHLAMVNGEVSKLKWLKKNRCPYDKSILTDAMYGDAKIYNWIVKNCIWYDKQVYEIIKKDDIGKLKWVVHSVPKLSNYVCEYASELNNFRILKWGVYKKFKYNYLTSSNAAMHGNLEMLKFLLKHNCTWNELLIVEAAEYGHKHIVEWCIENKKYKMDKYACAEAAKNNHLDMLVYLRENGCPWDVNTYISARNHPLIFKYVLDNNCPSE